MNISYPFVGHYTKIIFLLNIDKAIALLSKQRGSTLDVNIGWNLKYVWGTALVNAVFVAYCRVYLQPSLVYELMAWLKEKDEMELFKYWLFGCTGMAFTNVNMTLECYYRF